MENKLAQNMTHKLITVNERAQLLRAYELMTKNSIRHLPAVNADGDIVGIISERDLLRATDSTVIGDGVFRMESCDISPDKLVKDYMSWPVRTVDKSTPLKSVCSRMIQEKISAYLIIDGSEVMGIVTTDDMLRALYELLPGPEADFKTKVEAMFINPSIGQFAQSIADIGI